MSVASSIRSVFVPINREGYPFLLGAGLLCLLGTLVSLWLFWPLAILTAWVGYFFRDPPRVTPLREGLVVSPADGVVTQIASALPRWLIAFFATGSSSADVQPRSFRKKCGS